MPEVEAKIRSRNSSTTSDPRIGINRWKPEVGGGDDGAGGTTGPTVSNEEEFKPRKKPSKQHPAEKKAVMMKMGSLEDKERSDAFKKSPRSMIRRFSRAASFKRARQRLPVLDLQGILNQFEKHSTIHGICHAGIAPNKKWKHFWLGVFTICFAILIVQTIYLIVKFFQYPKTVDLDLKFEMTEFPAVTICNLNPYKASSISRDKSAQATIDAMETALQDSDSDISTFVPVVKKTTVERRKREPEGKQRRDMVDVEQAISHVGDRRYLQVYAQCYCEMNRLSSVRKQGSCFAAYKGRVSFAYEAGQELRMFYPAKCLCQLDWVAKALWPCFPYNTWKEHICTECVDTAGHCPMRFLKYRTVGQTASNRSGLHAIETLDEGLDVCICHRDYNHCVQNNMNGEIPEILPSDQLDFLNLTKHLEQRYSGSKKPAVPAAVHAALRKEEENLVEAEKKEAQKEALGFKNLTDEIAIKGQARQNLIYAMGEKSEQERGKLSQPMEEMILKCSFNQKDCDIKKDFKLYQDPTYGNCYTFNWDRNAQVTAHRAGANFGLRVLVYANVSEYLPTTEAIGFRITVHDKWTVPFVDAFGYNAPTGMLSSYGVRMKKFFRLEHPYGHCRTGGERELPDWYIYPGYNYSVEGCHRSCTQQEVIRTCGCADPMSPAPRTARRCAMKEQKARDCIQKTSSNLSALIAEEHLDSCKCPLPCYETAYELTYSAARWPSGTARLMECESTDELCMEKYRINAALIQVFYEEFNYQTLTESAAYSMTSLIADLGGLSGLWIGISVVSILEVVQLIWFCMEYIHKKKTSELLAMVRSASRRHSLDEESEPRKKPSSSTPSLPPRSGSGGNKSLKSLRSMRSFLQQPAFGEISPGLRVKGEIVYSQSSGSSTPYLAPSVELPCTCLYGVRGQIVFMKPLCPFHGYMVRRMMRRKSESEEDEEEADDGLEEGPLLTAEEVEALRSEAGLDRIESEGEEEEGEEEGPKEGVDEPRGDEEGEEEEEDEEESSSSTSDEKK